jgi:parallel beta-helix repeat protein
MKKAALTLITVFGLIVSLMVGVQFVNLGNANPSSLIWVPLQNAYIKSNGDIEPANLPIQRTGNIYALKDNFINYTIEIQKDNIVFDGNGFTLTTDVAASYPYTGPPLIQISNRTNVTVKNVKFEGGFTGIRVANSSKISILHSTFVGEEEGIYMASSVNCDIIDNKLTDNSGPGLFIVDGESSFLNISYNIISRNHGHGGWLTVSYSNITRNNITDNSFNNFGIGLYLYGPNSYNIIFENNFVNNEHGLFYQGSKGVSVGNQVYSNYWDNYQENIVNVAADDASGEDLSPITSPISIVFNPMQPTPSQEPTPTPEPISPALMAAVVILVAIGTIALIVVIGAGLLVYYRKNRKGKTQ